jgi:2-amino-4-hydroxy-6-hydroxymethyldihydropteridine diphosphokinase
VFVGLGSNMDDPVRQLHAAIREMGEIPGAALVRVSSLYRTDPVGIVDQPPFVNAVAQVETTLSPHDLLRQLNAIESRHGRIRGQKNGPRTLDLDILLFNEWRIDDEQLTTPHPRMHERAFVLVPLLEIAVAAHIPGRGAARQALDHVGAAGVCKLATEALAN